jgi:hypothetical protein
MSDVTLPSVPSIAAQTVRRVRSRRRVPREAGTDLLQLSSRVSEKEARVLAQARAMLFKLSAQPKHRELNSPSLVREYLTTLGARVFRGGGTRQPPPGPGERDPVRRHD